MYVELFRSVDVAKTSHKTNSRQNHSQRNIRHVQSPFVRQIDVLGYDHGFVEHIDFVCSEIFRRREHWQLVF